MIEHIIQFTAINTHKNIQDTHFKTHNRRLSFLLKIVLTNLKYKSNFDECVFQSLT